MKKYGLIGYPLSHSFSPSYFAQKFEALGLSKEARYDSYPLDTIEKLPALLKSGIKGLNVTIPYKEKVQPYLDKLSPEAAAIGAVNTIKISSEGITGHNTDVYGFEISLLQACRNNVPAQALILGTGGAAKAVKYVLDKHHVNYQLVSRSSGDLRYSDLTPEHIETHHLIINTTPLGMYPHVDSCPAIPYQGISEQHVLYDLVYNPEKTLFLKKGENQGAIIKNGLDMLTLQADRAWEIWNNK